MICAAVVVTFTLCVPGGQSIKKGLVTSDKGSLRLNFVSQLDGTASYKMSGDLVKEKIVKSENGDVKHVYKYGKVTGSKQDYNNIINEDVRSIVPCFELIYAYY